MNIPQLAQKLFEPFQTETAGNAVAVLWNHEVVYQHVAGQADHAHNTEVTTDTPFCIGSITKTMTAIHVMQLVEQGKIQLDDPIRDHLKQIPIHEPYIQNPIRIRHLLTHTSGLGYFRTWKDLMKPAGALGTLGQVPTLSEYYRDGLTPIYPTETKWLYCNHAYALLGQLVEDVTGQPFQQTFEDRVLRAAGMKSASLLRPPNRAMPYQKHKKGYKPALDLDIIVRPAGSVYASLNDMVQYVKSLLQHAPALLGPGGLEQMYQRQFEVSPQLMGMGLGFVLQRLGAHELRFHTGGWIGYNSAMYLHPETGSAVVMLSNSEAPRIMTLPEQFFREALQVQLEESTTLPLSSLKFARSYGEPTRGLEKTLAFLTQPGGLKLMLQNGQLVLKTLIGPWRKGMGLKPRGGHLFEIQDTIQPMLCELEVSGNQVVAIRLGLNRLTGHF